jgi:hypothetical protein
VREGRKSVESLGGYRFFVLFFLFFFFKGMYTVEYVCLKEKIPSNSIRCEFWLPFVTLLQSGSKNLFQHSVEVGPGGAA